MSRLPGVYRLVELAQGSVADIKASSDSVDGSDFDELMIATLNDCIEVSLFKSALKVIGIYTRSCAFAVDLSTLGMMHTLTPNAGKI